MKTRPMVFIAILVAIEVVLTRFFAIETPIIRVGFGFVPITLSAIIFGPIIGGITAATADVLGMLLFPKGVYFPGFTLSAFLTGLTYGLFLYNKPKKFFNITLSVLIITLVIHLGLNTLWISILTGKAYRVLILPRIIKELLLIPVQIILIHFSWQYAGRKIREKFLLFNKN